MSLSFLFTKFRINQVSAQLRPPTPDQLSQFAGDILSQLRFYFTTSFVFSFSKSELLSLFVHRLSVWTWVKIFFDFEHNAGSLGGSYSIWCRINRKRSTAWKSNIVPRSFNYYVWSRWNINEYIAKSSERRQGMWRGCLQEQTLLCYSPQDSSLVNGKRLWWKGIIGWPEANEDNRRVDSTGSCFQNRLTFSSRRTLFVLCDRLNN